MALEAELPRITLLTASVEEVLQNFEAICADAKDQYGHEPATDGEAQTHAIAVQLGAELSKNRGRVLVVEGPACTFIKGLVGAGRAPEQVLAVSSRATSLLTAIRKLGHSEDDRLRRVQVHLGRLSDFCAGLQVDDTDAEGLAGIVIEGPTGWEACREDIMACLRCRCLKAGARLLLTLVPPGQPQPQTQAQAQHLAESLAAQMLADCEAAKLEAGYQLALAGTHAVHAEGGAVTSVVVQVRVGRWEEPFFLLGPPTSPGEKIAQALLRRQRAELFARSNCISRTAQEQQQQEKKVEGEQEQQQQQQPEKQEPLPKSQQPTGQASPQQDVGALEILALDETAGGVVAELLAAAAAAQDAPGAGSTAPALPAAAAPALEVAVAAEGAAPVQLASVPPATVSPMTVAAAAPEPLASADASQLVPAQDGSMGPLGDVILLVDPAFPCLASSPGAKRHLPSPTPQDNELCEPAKRQRGNAAGATASAKDGIGSAHAAGEAAAAIGEGLMAVYTAKETAVAELQVVPAAAPKQLGGAAAPTSSMEGEPLSMVNGAGVAASMPSAGGAPAAEQDAPAAAGAAAVPLASEAPEVAPSKAQDTSHQQQQQEQEQEQQAGEEATAEPQLLLAVVEDRGPPATATSKPAQPGASFALDGGPALPDGAPAPGEAGSAHAQQEQQLSKRQRKKQRQQERRRQAASQPQQTQAQVQQPPPQHQQQPVQRAAQVAQPSKGSGAVARDASAATARAAAQTALQGRKSQPSPQANASVGQKRPLSHHQQGPAPQKARPAQPVRGREAQAELDRWRQRQAAASAAGAGQGNLRQGVPVGRQQQYGVQQGQAGLIFAQQQPGPTLQAQATGLVGGVGTGSSQFLQAPGMLLQHIQPAQQMQHQSVGQGSLVGQQQYVAQAGTAAGANSGQLPQLVFMQREQPNAGAAAPQQYMLAQQQQLGPQSSTVSQLLYSQAQQQQQQQLQQGLLQRLPPGMDACSGVQQGQAGTAPRLGTTSVLQNGSGQLLQQQGYLQQGLQQGGLMGMQALAVPQPTLLQQPQQPLPQLFQQSSLAGTQQQQQPFIAASTRLGSSLLRPAQTLAGQVLMQQSGADRALAGMGQLGAPQPLLSVQGQQQGQQGLLQGFVQLGTSQQQLYQQGQQQQQQQQPLYGAPGAAGVFPRY